MVELVDEEEAYVNMCAVAEAEAESVPLIDTTIERCSSSKVVDVEEADANTWAG
mgnify:CR=1 FL=1